MFRLAWRLGALFIVFTAFSWAVRLDSTNAFAQDTRAANIKSSDPADTVPLAFPASAGWAVPDSSNAGSISAVASAQTRPAIVVASGSQYANVRALATDAARGLYISLSSTPPAKNCVSSLPQPATAAADSSSSTAAAAATIPLTLTIFSNCTLAPSEDPFGIATAPANKIYLANRAQNTIRLLDMLSGKVLALPAGSSKNLAEGEASSNLDPYLPAGLASDAQGNLYVADRGNNRVLALASRAAQFTFVAHVLDAAALAVDTQRGRLYVASPAANRVFVIDLSTADVEAFAGSGAFSGGANTSGGDAKSPFPSDPQSAQIGSPEGVAVDAQGNVFISDTAANALLRVDAKTGDLSRVAAAENFSSPGALAIDRSGDVFVADRGNERVLVFPQLAAQTPSGNVTLSPASNDFGDEPTGGTTAAQVFTLTNNSASALALTNASFTFAGANPLDFAQTNNCVPSLAVGASCQINVTFTPSKSGARSASIEVTDSDPSSPQTATLTGTGDDFELTVPNVTDTTQNVAAGSNATYTITVTPDGTFNGTVALGCPRAFTEPPAVSLDQANVTCTINPTTLAITANQPQNFTVTLTTGGPNATRILPWSLRNNPGGRIRFLLLGFFTLVAGLLAWTTRRTIATGAGAQFAGLHPRKRARFSGLALGLLAAAAAGGCGGSSSVNPNQTPTSSYTLEIIGTAQNASRSITLTLNVD